MSDGENGQGETEPMASKGERPMESAKSQNGPIGMVVSSAKSPTFYHFDFRLNPGRHVHPGMVVGVRGENSGGESVLLIGRVADAQDYNPHEDPASSVIRNVVPFDLSYAGEGQSTVIFRIAGAELLEEVLLDSQDSPIEIKSPVTLPRAGWPVVRADPVTVNAALGLEQDPNSGLWVGTIYGNPENPVTLKKEVLQRHVLVVGGIGTGKSYTRGVLGEEAHSWGVPQVNIDVNGEMVEAALQLGGKNLVPGEGFTLPLSALTSQEVVDAVPSIDSRSVMAELVRHSHEELLKKSGKDGEPFGVDDLVAKIQEVGPSLEMRSQTINPASSRVQNLGRLPFIGDPFDWEKELAPGAFINIDCRGMFLGDLRIIVAAVARDIQRLARARRIPFVIFSVDEFHLVAPKDEDTVPQQVLREMARIGRHHRIGLILTTQSPSDVDRPILKRLLTRFLHAIEPDQLDALRGVFSDASEELVNQLPKLPQGVCVLTGAFETVRHATVVQVRKRFTEHGGKTPDVWADLKERGWKGAKKQL